MESKKKNWFKKNLKILKTKSKIHLYFRVIHSIIPLLSVKHFLCQRNFSCHPGHKTKAVQPSRSALSDLGLIADLFEKILLNWSSFCLKSPLFGLKSPKSQIFYFSSFHVKQNNYLKFSLTMEYFQKKVILPNAGIRFWEKV